MTKKQKINKIISKGGMVANLHENRELYDWVEPEDRMDYVHYRFKKYGVFYYLGNTPNEAEMNYNSITMDDWKSFDDSQLDYFLGGIK